jgi:anti-sigma regulatory factor (Ser/Thr protein kinase)
LRVAAAELGLRVTGEFVERRPGDRVTVWRSMIATCRSVGVRDVLVPGLEHLAANPVLAGGARQELAEAIRGRVWVAGDATSRRATMMDPSDKKTVELAPELGASALARSFTRAALREWKVTDTKSDDVLLAVSELVGNAVRHADACGAPVLTLVRLPRQRAVRVEVEDGSGRPPVLEWAGSEAESGRGLYIVSVISKEWGFTPTKNGKTVWACIGLT